MTVDAAGAFYNGIGNREGPDSGPGGRMNVSDQDSAKLHIDSDWKAEAAKEKERLSEQERKSPPPGTTAGPPTFLELLDLIVMQVAVALGGYAGPGGERFPPNPQAAKHFIDMLEMVEQKTRGNLTDEEKRVLETVLYELRMQFVQVMGRAPAPAVPAAPAESPKA